MNAEIALLGTTFPAAILGVNADGQEADNALMCAGRVLPWLQDGRVDNVWSLWSVTYRDVVVLDPTGHVTAIYNLTAHDLADPASYAELKALIVAAAGP